MILAEWMPERKFFLSFLSGQGAIYLYLALIAVVKVSSKISLLTHERMVFRIYSGVIKPFIHPN